MGGAASTDRGTELLDATLGVASATEAVAEAARDGAVAIAGIAAAAAGTALPFAGPLIAVLGSLVSHLRDAKDVDLRAKKAAVWSLTLCGLLDGAAKTLKGDAPAEVATLIEAATEAATEMFDLCRKLNSASAIGRVVNSKSFLKAMARVQQTVDQALVALHLELSVETLHEVKKIADIDTKVDELAAATAATGQKVDALLKSKSSREVNRMVVAKLEIDPNDLTLDEPPLARGGFAAVYAGTYGGVRVAAKKIMCTGSVADTAKVRFPLLLLLCHCYLMLLCDCYCYCYCRLTLPFSTAKTKRPTPPSSASFLWCGRCGHRSSWRPLARAWARRTRLW